MKVKDLYPAYIDKIIVYEEVNEGEYRNLYKGLINNAPADIKAMEVQTIMAKKKNVLDIGVERSK